MSSLPPSRPARPLRGLAIFAVAIVCFACLDATSKHLSRSYPVPWLAWARYVVHFLGMTLALGPKHGLSLVRTHRPFAQGIRGAALVSVTVLMMAAFRRMPLAEATAVLFASPLLVSLLARPLLGERIGPVRWSAVLVGFAGVFLLTRPDTGLDPLGTALALAASVAYAFYQIMTRALSRTETPLTLVYYTALVGTVSLTLAFPWIGWPRELHLGDLLFVGSLGAFGGTGHFLLALAFREAPASLLSPLVYTQLVWAGVLGFVVFGDVPAASALVGMGVVLAAGLLLAWDGRRAAGAR